MRPPILDTAHRWPQRALLSIMGLVTRTDPDPVIKVVLYRPDFFGRDFIRLAETTMRGPSEWTPGERELMAAVVSRQNQCPFCAGVHEGISSILLPVGDRTWSLDEWRDSDLEPRLRSAFEMVEKVTRAPASVGPEDILRMRAAGVSDAGIREALQVAFVFNTVNRLANAFDMHWVDESGRMKLASGLNAAGYRLPGFILR